MSDSQCYWHMQQNEFDWWNTDPSGTLFFGKRVDGKFTGHYCLIFPKGKKAYMGEMKDDLFDGEGVLFSPSGLIYSGQWQRGYAHGWGMLFDTEKYWDCIIDKISPATMPLPWEPQLDMQSSRFIFLKQVVSSERENFIRETHLRHEGVFSKNIPLGPQEQFYDLESPPFDIGKWEGTARYQTHIVYERNRENREIALQIHGHTCMACGIDYESIYGNNVEVIEVHHIRPVSMGPAIYDPHLDLVPLCRNCHRAIHSGKFGDPEIALEVLIEFLKGKRKPTLMAR